MSNLKINHLAVWICIILMHVFGFIWYGPLFGQKWMALVELDQATMQQESMNIGIWILNTVAIIAPIYLLAWLFTSSMSLPGFEVRLLLFSSHFVFTICQS